MGSGLWGSGLFELTFPTDLDGVSLVPGMMDRLYSGSNKSRLHKVE